MIHIHTFSEAGGHPVNEDAFVATRIPGEADGVFVCLADGQGGRAGGAAAAQGACRATSEHVNAHLGTVFGEPYSWVEILGHADAAVATDSVAGFTTLVSFVVEGDHIAGASCGDSAVLALCGSGTIAELTKHQFKNPPVGSGEAIFVPFEMKFTRPWKILAMTDGVWKYVGWDRIHALAREHCGEELLTALQNAARLPRSGQFQDDFTVVLLEATE